MNVGDDASRRNCGFCDKFIQLLIVLDRELEVTRLNCLLSVLVSRITSKLTDLARQILHDGGRKNSSTLTDRLRVPASLDHRVDATNREDEATLRACTLRGLSCSTFLGADLLFVALGWHLALSKNLFDLKFVL